MDFETYVARHRTALLRLAVVLTDDPELAQDVVQDVLLRAQQRWGRIGGLDLPHAYVRRMLANHVISWRRKWGRVQARPDRELDRSVTDAADEVGRRDAIVRQVAKLPPRQRAAVVLRYFEELSDAEIAATLGCRPVTVRGYLHRALRTLRVELSDESSDEAGTAAARRRPAKEPA